MLCKWRFFILFIFVFFYFNFGAVKVSAQFAGGVGSSANPYQIEDCYQLQDIGTSVSSYFILNNDIDCSETSTWNVDVGNTYFGFEPILDFDGNFDGKGFVISGLYINRGTEINVGLFSDAYGGMIKDVGLSGVDITGNMNVGGLVGLLFSDGLVENISIDGRVVATDGNVGGIIGRLDSAVSEDITIDGLIFNGTVSGVNGAIGGLIGLVEDSLFLTKIINSYSSGIVGGGTAYDVGGLVGVNDDEEINNSYSTCDVNGNDGVGGLVGYNAGIIRTSYASGEVSGNNSVGGLVGYNYQGHIENTYATGNIVGVYDNIGGLVGSSGGGTVASSIINSYATGDVIGGLNYIGGLVGYLYRDLVSNSFSIGDVTATDVGGTGVGGLIGGLIADSGDADPMFFLDNNGWYTGGTVPSFAVGEVLIDNGGDFTLIGSTEVTYTESDNTVYFSSSHGVYDVGSTVWDFTTPIWYEWTNTYPLFIPQPLETPTPTPTLTPTPTGTVLGTTTNSSGGLPVCTDLPPVLAPNLFQITAEKNGARLYYTPIVGQVDGYTITYGYFEGDERWAVIAPVINNNQGVQNYYIGSLDGNKTYYFKVTAKNGCCVGPWSTWKSIKVNGGSVAGSAQELPQTGMALPTIILVFGSLLTFTGVGLIRSKT